MAVFKFELGRMYTGEKVIEEFVIDDKELEGLNQDGLDVLVNMYYKDWKAQELNISKEQLEFDVNQKLFDKFREQLPKEINRNSIESVVRTCVDRMRIFNKDDEEILVSLDASLNEDEYRGDIEVLGNGTQWIFSRDGEFHTS